MGRRYMVRMTMRVRMKDEDERPCQYVTTEVEKNHMLVLVRRCRRTAERQDSLQKPESEIEG